MARNDLIAPPVRPDGLQIDEHRAAQERFWIAERIAHLAFGAIVLLALLGVAGAGGPLATARIATDAGRIVLPRIGRWQTAETIAITFAAPAPTHRIRLTSPAWATMRLGAVNPAPARALALPDGILLEFAADGAGASAAIELTPTEFGRKRLAIGLDDAAPVAATITVLP